MDQLRRILDGETITERAAGKEPDYTDEFFIEECRFTAGGRNPWFSLRPGYQLYLAGHDKGDFIELYITVLDEFRDICFTKSEGRNICVKTRVVEEREFINGQLYEVSRNYYARCRQTNDVMYFGEDVCFYDRQGNCVSTEGSWLAGVNGAMPGVIMPGSFMLGARYFQEIAPGVAEDRAENVEMDLDITVPAGTFDDCVVVLETSPLDPGAEDEKVYARGVGLVMDAELELVSYGFLPGFDSDPGNAGE